jgi:hypothetical protein
MTEVNFGADVAAAEKEFNIGKGSDKFKFKEGENRVRVLSASVPLQNTYKGETRVKFVTQVWDYDAAKDQEGKSIGKLQLAFFPITIVRAIAAMQAKPDYAFTEVPMPYDLLIDAKNAGTIDAEYSVTAARTNTPVPQEALDALAKEKPIAEIGELIKQKNAQTETNSEELPV